MISITYAEMVIFISIVWCVVRAAFILRRRKFSLMREAQLLLVYICLVVIARFTFFPFSTVNGVIQPLVFDPALAWPFRINIVPFVNLLDYPDKKDILLNVIGNSAMFIPVGIVWPIVYRELDSHRKVIAAGVGFSLLIELLQLPFFDRVTDIDDLLLNSFGFVLGYLIYLASKRVLSRKH